MQSSLTETRHSNRNIGTVMDLARSIHPVRGFRCCRRGANGCLTRWGVCFRALSCQAFEVEDRRVRPAARPRRRGPRIAPSRSWGESLRHRAHDVVSLARTARSGHRRAHRGAGSDRAGASYNPGGRAGRGTQSRPGKRCIDIARAEPGAGAGNREGPCSEGHRARSRSIIDAGIVVSDGHPPGKGLCCGATARTVALSAGAGTCPRRFPEKRCTPSKPTLDYRCPP